MTEVSFVLRGSMAASMWGGKFTSGRKLHLVKASEADPSIAYDLHADTSSPITLCGRPAKPSDWWRDDLSAVDPRSRCYTCASIARRTLGHTWPDYEQPT